MGLEDIVRRIGTGSLAIAGFTFMAAGMEIGSQSVEAKSAEETSIEYIVEEDEVKPTIEFLTGGAVLLSGASLMYLSLGLERRRVYEMREEYRDDKEY